MKAFWALARNEVRSSMRNRVALIFTLGLALFFMLIFGLVFGGNSVSVTYALLDNDHTPRSQQLSSALRSVSGVTVNTESLSAATDDLRNNKADIIVVVPKGFGAAIDSGGPHVQLQPVQGSQPSINAAPAEEILSGVLSNIVNKGNPEVSVAAPGTSSVNQVSKIDYFFPAMIAYIILQSGINYVAIGLAELRVLKVLKRFRATPLRPAQILSAQIAGGALIVVLQLIVLIAAGLLIFQAKVYGSWLVAAVPMIIGTLAFVGIGFLLTSAARTSETARALAALVAFPMMFLSGVFIPVTTLPSWLQTLVHILPLTWLTDALHRVMNDGSGFDAIGLDLLVLAGWAVVTFAIATWRFRWD